VYVLGGYQTDFARNWTREGGAGGGAAGGPLFGMFAEAVPAALADAAVDAAEVQVAHVGNLAGELFAGQAQLGAFVPAALPELLGPDLAGIPTSRHEAACAAGGVSVLAAMADLEAGRYDVALVAGAELMRNVPPAEAAGHLGTAAWAGREAQDAAFPWVTLFAEVAAAYDRLWGIDRAHLARIAEINLTNARRNPNAQTRGWELDPAAFGTGGPDGRPDGGTDHGANPVVAGMLRKLDCGRITDGAAALVLASAGYARAWAARRNLPLERVPVLRGWGHRTGPLLLADKLAAARPDGLLFPHFAAAVQDAYRRAGRSGPGDVDVAEVHDCFTVTEYTALEHIGLTGPGLAWQAVEKDVIAPGGALPVNPGGGLLGIGHPVGATGVRQVLDAARQVAGGAGECQVEGARTALTVNVGGSCTTVVSFVLGPGA
jgi:acetyl-CoA C-acetyltransferase